MKMNMEVLDVIHAVLAYKRFIICHDRVVAKNGFDWYDQATSYFNSLPLPDGMSHNRNTLEKILHYDKGLLAKYDSCEAEELVKYDF